MDSYIRKIILVGDGAVGKTSLVRRFVVNMYSDRYIQTVGAKVSKKDVDLGDAAMILMIWDIMGQTGFRRTQLSSLENSKGAVLVADLTMPETLDSLLNYWIPMIIRSVGPIPLAIVGNKCDLEAKFGLAQLEKVASSCDYFGTVIPCCLTSAKTGENVEAAFTGLAGRIRAYSGMPVPEPEMSLDMKAADPLVDILDRIFVDFSEQFGGLEHSTPFIRQQMKLAGLDLDNPTPKSIETFIENLAAIESGHRPMKDVLANKKQRYGLFRNRLPGLYGI